MLFRVWAVKATGGSVALEANGSITENKDNQLLRKQTLNHHLSSRHWLSRLLMSSRVQSRTTNSTRSYVSRWTTGTPRDPKKDRQGRETLHGCSVGPVARRDPSCYVRWPEHHWTGLLASGVVSILSILSLPPVTGAKSDSILQITSQSSVHITLRLLFKLKWLNSVA